MQEQAERERMGLSAACDRNARDNYAEEDWKWRAFDMDPKSASALGISPLALTAAMRVGGVGVLAKTPVPVRLLSRSAFSSGPSWLGSPLEPAVAARADDTSPEGPKPHRC